jgi:uncharacterized membrane protein YeaQ/YmgE (transglycosylase-associated protein family)
MMVLVEFAKINFGIGIVGWIVVGLIAGWLADVANGGPNSNLPVSFALGIVGALIGGFILGLLFDGTTGVIMSIVVAFIGAMLLSFIVRKVMGANSPV